MDIYFIIGLIIIGAGSLFVTIFVNIFVEQFKKEEDDVGYIEGLIVYRT